MTLSQKGTEISPSLAVPEGSGVTSAGVRDVFVVFCEQSLSRSAQPSSHLPPRLEPQRPLLTAGKGF